MQEMSAQHRLVPPAVHSHSTQEKGIPLKRLFVCSHPQKDGSTKVQSRTPQPELLDRAFSHIQIDYADAPSPIQAIRSRELPPDHQIPLETRYAVRRGHAAKSTAALSLSQSSEGLAVFLHRF